MFNGGNLMHCLPSIVGAFHPKKGYFSHAVADGKS
jgi:hypothetical protein